VDADRKARSVVETEPVGESVIADGRVGLFRRRQSDPDDDVEDDVFEDGRRKDDAGERGRRASPSP
jgi:hypothetical protein